MAVRIAAAVAGAICCATLAPGAEAKHLIRGFSYGPAPVKDAQEVKRLPEDDYFCDEAAPMWSSKGRADLMIMREMGANFVRLYGNDPRQSHAGFLDEAHRHGLQVSPGMSDWPYYQRLPDNCKDATDYNCFSQVKRSYAANLGNGFLRADGTYHPAVRVVNILNEPDLKMPTTATMGGPEGPVQMARSLISAFDAMLEAEKEMNVTGPLVNFTVTFSYAICKACDRFTSSPALGQMAQLTDAMHHPEKYGYVPKNDIAEAYRLRWMHSFNTQNPATDLQHQFLDDYNQAFPTTPVYIGEYHRVGANQTEDLGMILQIAERNELFFGISFFEFTVSYYKSGEEQAFGMFGYGDLTVAPMSFFRQPFDIPCLDPIPNPQAGTSMAEAVARVYGGSLNVGMMCGGTTSTSTSTTTTTITSTTVTTTTVTTTTVTTSTSTVSTTSSTTSTLSTTSTTTSTMTGTSSLRGSTTAIAAYDASATTTQPSGTPPWWSVLSDARLAGVLLLLAIALLAALVACCSRRARGGKLAGAAQSDQFGTGSDEPRVDVPPLHGAQVV